MLKKLIEQAETLKSDLETVCDELEGAAECELLDPEDQDNEAADLYEDALAELQALQAVVVAQAAELRRLIDPD